MANVAQSAVGRPPSKGCDPWDPLKPTTRSLDDPPPLVMLHMLTSHVVPAERALETPVQFSFVYLMHSSW
ncbi:hypothetical protein OEZ86_004059 [Tetradesmus obliquus]|nr:hypothetical protein OEZ86_004059 [Tetradesmus obliquus]